MVSIKQTLQWATYSNWVFLFSLGFYVKAQAKVFLTTTEALDRMFPKSAHCEVKATTKYLTSEQMKAAEILSGLPTLSALVVQYTANCAGKLEGFAYTDTHKVRTHPETLFIAMDSDGRLTKSEVLSFDEPLDYIPKDQWYQSFEQKRLDDELQIKRAIPYVTGASLTTKATLLATRRVLAIHQVLTKTNTVKK